MSPDPNDGAADFDPTESLPSMQAGGGPRVTQRAAMDSGNALPPGTYLSEFEVLSLAGEGGFGIVYRAWDHSLKRQVAIKEYLPTSLASRVGGLQVSVRSERHAEPFFAGLQSFVKEAQMLAQFDHPALVKVYRFWEANGSAYMVMPFYEGKTLREELRQRPEPPDEATVLGWIGPVADALAVIHAEHWYHRDIAPDNVLLLAGSNRPLLLDFGAARRVIGDMTQALTVILKPGYAPVEQYAEIPGMKQGPWTDVYALAGVAYYALRGKTPPPSVGRLVNDNYESLAGTGGGRYSERFLGAIDRALVVRPDGRTKTIAEFKADLGIEAGAPLQPNNYPTGRTARHEPGIALADVGLDLNLPDDEPSPTLRLHPPPPERTALAPPPVAERTRVVKSPVHEKPVLPPQPAAGLAPPPAKGSRRGVAIGLAALALAGIAGVAGFVALRPRGEAPAVVATAASAPAATPAATAAASAPSATPTGPAATPVLAFDVGNEFERVVAAQTRGWGLEVKVDRDRLRVDKDKLVFTLRSLQEGFVYVFYNSADGALQQLYPNGVTPPPRIAKGGALKLPQGALDFNVEGPPGTSRLLVVVSRWPREHKAFAPREKDGFVSFPTGAEAALLAATSKDKLPLIAGRALCPAGASCNDEFGAATTSFEAVP